MNVTQTEEILRSAVQTVTVMEEIREVQTETVRQIIAAGHQQQVLQEEAEETVLRKAAEEPRAAMTMMPTESVLILIIRKHQMHMEILKKNSSGNGSWILKIWLILKKTSLNSFGIMKIRRSAGIF